VPSLDELRSFEEDGTLRMSEAPPPTDPAEFDQMVRVYSKDKQEPDGTDIDLRQSMDLIELAGSDEVHVTGELPAPAAPKYDPETGELLRPLDVAGEEQHVNPADIPLAKPTLDYARLNSPQAEKRISPAIELLKPVNLVTQGFALLFALAGSFFLIPGIPVIAHFSNVIEDIGPDDRDELPRFLRDFSFSQDIFFPCMYFMQSILFCFGPVLFFGRFIPGDARIPGVLALTVLGIIFFPAVLLTSTTSGALDNLRPDRVFGVIAAIGGRYILLILMMLAVVAIDIFRSGVLQFILFAKWRLRTPFVAEVGMLAVEMYLMHYFCWSLGLTWRKFHDRFPWVFQRFIPSSPRRFPQTSRNPANNKRAPRPRGWAQRLKNTTAEKSADG